VRDSTDGGWGTIGGSPLFHTYRVEAQAAVDAHPGDLGAARGLGEAMTFDDLINYTLVTLTEPAPADNPA